MLKVSARISALRLGYELPKPAPIPQKRKFLMNAGERWGKLGKVIGRQRTATESLWKNAGTVDFCGYGVWDYGLQNGRGGHEEASCGRYQTMYVCIELAIEWFPTEAVPASDLSRQGHRDCEDPRLPGTCACNTATAHKTLSDDANADLLTHRRTSVVHHRETLAVNSYPAHWPVLTLDNPTPPHLPRANRSDVYST